MDPNDTTPMTRQLLKAGATDYANARRNRILLIQLGRQNGLTWQQIGQDLGMTAPGARTLWERNWEQVAA